MNSFLQQTAQSIIETIDWKQLSRTTLVLPSHRAGLVLKNELLRLQQEHHAQAIWAPQVRTLTQLQDELSPLYAEDELFTIVRLYKLYLSSFDYQKSNDPMPLDMFYGWGRQMLADFTNVDASMTPSEVPNFFENTIAAHELEQWKMDPETEERLRSLLSDNTGLDTVIHENSIRAQYEHLWQRLYELYQALNEEMAAEKKGYAGMRQRAVLNAWEDESIQSKIADRIYIFVGFNYLLPVERDLMMRLKDNGQALFYWDYVKDFKTNRKAFSFAERNSELLPNKLPPRLWNNPRPVTVITCVSHEAQAQYVHRWLKENYTRKGQKVGVVICDETMLEPVIYTLPPIVTDGEKEPAPINITKGFPLRNTALYARVLGWLGDKARGKADDVVSPDIIDRMLEALFPQIQQGTNDIESPKCQEQEGLKWQELLILESEYQLRKIANQMRLLIANGLGDVPFTLKLLRLLMRRMMENVTMPFHGEPVTDIQVMGVLETRLLDFDKLLLLNVEEGIIPQRHTDISFIPFYLRKTYHMQTSDERATVYAYNFFRLLSRVGNATLLFAAAETAEGGKGMSRFIMQMLYSPEFEVTSNRLPEQSILAKMDEERLRTSGISIRSRLVVGEDGIIRRIGGKEYVLSPSALNTYIDCPRKFCFRYIQGLKEPEKEETQFEQNTLGEFVHYTIEYIYKEYLGCDNIKPPVFVSPDQIRAINTPEHREVALKDAYRLMNEEWQKQHPDEKEHYIMADHAHKENIIIDGYVQNILERDEKDAAEGLQICLLEAERYFRLPIEGIGSLRIGGKIDRLDILGVEGQEKIRVIDYKTGKFKQEDLSASMGSLFENKNKNYVRQTLLYCHAVAEQEQQNNEKCLPVEPNLFFCRYKLTGIKTNLSVDRKPVKDFSEISGMFLESLSEKVKELLTTTDFPPCAEKDCKKYCPFLNYCGRKVMEFEQ